MLSALGGPLAASIPSPSQGVWYLGHIPIRAYALCILAGVIVAWVILERRYTRRGGPKEVSIDVAVWMVLVGIIGARLYHVVTLPDAYFGPNGDPTRVVRIWEGGLGVMGGIAFGALAGWLVMRAKGLRFSPFVDSLAPGLLVAQAIGRWGNWFNQELYGKPTELPWGLEIDAAHLPPGVAEGTLFHPTFLYESMWTLTGALVLVAVDRRWHLTHGRLFSLYLIWYGTGRTFIESLRIDDTVVHFGLRVNQVFSLSVLLTGVVLLIVTSRWARRNPGEPIWLPGREPASEEPHEA